MSFIFYEKAADEKNYLYHIHFHKMDTVGYAFYGSHVHRSVEAVVCYESQLEYKVNDQKGVLNAGEVLLINSFSTHFYKSINDASCHIFVFSLDLINDALLNKDLEFNNIIKLSKENFSSLIKLLDDSSPYLDNYSFLERKSFSLMFFGILEKNGDLYRKKTENKELNIALKILKYIDEHYKETITLSNTSKAFGYNPNYFSTLFYKVIGVSFIDYLNSFRMDKVNELRKKPECSSLTIKELSKMCGFSTTEKYYRTVKRIK